MLQLKQLKPNEPKKLASEESGKILGGLMSSQYKHVITATEDGGWSCGSGTSSLFRGSVSKLKR